MNPIANLASGVDYQNEQQMFPSLPDVEKHDLRVSLDEPSSAVDLVALLASSLNGLEKWSIVSMFN